jgi:hypothetical protein
MSLWNWVANRPFVHPKYDIDYMNEYGATVECGGKGTGESRRSRRKTCLSATLSTNPTWNGPGREPGSPR